MDEKFETLIERQIILWYDWLENDKKVRNTKLEMSERKRAADNCERIVNEKYKNIASIDRFIDGLKKS